MRFGDKKMRTLITILSFIFISCQGSPVRSMIGAEGAEHIQGNDSPFPEGVVPVEYIESTGSQYIDTGVIVNSRSTVEFEVQVVNYNDGCMGLYEASSGGRMLYINFYGNKIYPRYGYFSPSSAQLNPYDGWIRFGVNRVVFSNGTIIINETIAYSDISISGLDTLTKPMILFAYMRVNNIQGYTKARVFRFRIWNVDELILDIVPVREGEVGAMYDLVSGGLFYNQGTGAFIIGPDKE